MTLSDSIINSGPFWAHDICVFCDLGVRSRSCKSISKFIFTLRSFDPFLEIGNPKGYVKSGLRELEMIAILLTEYS